jgi:hypothetical protein
MLKSLVEMRMMMKRSRNEKIEVKICVSPKEGGGESTELLAVGKVDK